MIALAARKQKKSGAQLLWRIHSELPTLCVI